MSADQNSTTPMSNGEAWIQYSMPRLGYMTAPAEEQAAFDAGWRMAMAAASKLLEEQRQRAAEILREEEQSMTDQPNPTATYGLNDAMNMPRHCGFCGQWHKAKCPTVKAFSYHPDGTLARVEFFAPADYPRPMPWAGSPPIGMGNAGDE